MVEHILRKEWAEGSELSMLQLVVICGRLKILSQK